MCQSSGDHQNPLVAVFAHNFADRTVHYSNEPNVGAAIKRINSIATFISHSRVSPPAQIVTFFALPLRSPRRCYYYYYYYRSHPFYVWYAHIRIYAYYYSLFPVATAAVFRWVYNQSLSRINICIYVYGRHVYHWSHQLLFSLQPLHGSIRPRIPRPFSARETSIAVFPTNIRQSAQAIHTTRTLLYVCVCSLYVRIKDDDRMEINTQISLNITDWTSTGYLYAP